MIRRIVSIIGCGLFSLLAQGAFAQLNYAQKVQNIRCGVLLIDSMQIVPGTQANYNPYVWHNIDQNRNVKPAGWNFYNPLAPGQVTVPIQTRWSTINTANGTPGLIPVVGARVSKKDAPYWEVRLSQSTDEQLSQYDVLSLDVQGYMSLNPDERGRLRRFMESGGVLWVDITAAATLDVINGLPMPFGISGTNLGGGLDWDYFHPVMNFPNTITANVLLSAQSEALIGLRTVDLASLGFGDLRELQQPTEGEYGRFYHVAADQFGPFLSVAKIGDGFMAVTARGLAYTLNRTQRVVDGMGAGYINNNLSVAESYFTDATGDAAARIVINIANLTSGHPQYGGGSHKGNGGPIDVGAPLLRKFFAEIAFDPGATNYRPPAIYKGCVAQTIGDRLFLFDMDSARDLDNDGNPDDGVPDYSEGRPYDLLWTSDRLTQPLSAPAFAEVPNSTIFDQVSIVDGDGNLLIYNLHSVPSKTVIPAFTENPPAGWNAPPNTDHGRGPFAPTFYDGLWFVADDVTVGISTFGRVWVADATDGQVLNTSAPWAVGGNGVTQMQRPSSSPTIGDIPIQDGSGGTDRVVYVPTRPNPSGGPQATAGVTSLWFGVKGEKPSTFNQVANQLVVTTRAAIQGLRIYMPSGPSPLGVRLSVIDANGNPLNANQMDILFTTGVSEANGQLTFTMEPAQVLPPGASLRVDYTIDWGTGSAPIQNQIIRGSIYLPDTGLNRDRMILDHVALSARGTLHIVAADPTNQVTLNGEDGGTYYALEETGRGSFTLLDRYDLYPAHVLTPNQAAQINYAETLFDTDPLQSFAGPFLGGAFQRLRFRSGPTVVGDSVYVTAVGYKFGGFVPCNIVMAFKANPPTAEIILPEVTGSFTIVQPDFARNTNRLRPVVMSVLQPGQYVYEGGARDGMARIRIANLSPNQRGLIQNAISRSQPILIRRAGQPDLLVEPDRNSPNWSSLQWYAVFHGYDNYSPVEVTGGTLYFAGNSRLPSILRGDAFPFNDDGLVLGMDSIISNGDSFLNSNPSRPWLKQLWQLSIPSPGVVTPNPDIRWPQTRGVTNFNEWRQRLFQTVVDPDASYGVIAGDGGLVVWGRRNITGFGKGDTIVADESRIVKFDGNGNPIWSSDASATTGTSLDSGAAGDVKPLVRATRAYSLSNREMMVVDTGGDRLIRLDSSGREMRSITGFHLDPTTTAPAHNGFIPTGFETNESLTLRQPRDVHLYYSYQRSPLQFSNATALELWVHYLIADAGNRRLIELIDRYQADPVTKRIIGVVRQLDGNLALGVLNWHSPANFTGKNFQYTGVSSTFDAITGPFPVRRYVASIGSALPTRTGLGLDTPTPTSTVGSEEGNGGLVIFDDTIGIENVISEIYVPDIPANVFWDPGTASFNSAAQPAHMKKIKNVRSVSMRLEAEANGVVHLCVMFTDSDGVFEVFNNGANWEVRWMLPREAYLTMRRDYTAPFGVPIVSQNPMEFAPMYARRLDAGQVLVVNGWVGKMQDGATDFKGEVFEVDGSFQLVPVNTEPGYNLTKPNLGFSWFSVLYQLPPVTGARSIVLPIFADRR